MPGRLDETTDAGRIAEAEAGICPACQERVEPGAKTAPLHGRTLHAACGAAYDLEVRLSAIEGRMEEMRHQISALMAAEAYR